MPFLAINSASTDNIARFPYNLAMKALNASERIST